MPIRNLIERFDQLVVSLAPAERAITEWILSDPIRASRQTIYEMSDSIGVAKSTISKLVRKLGYRGFREFRSDLLLSDFDSGMSIVPDIEPSDSLSQILEKTFRTSLQTLSRAQETIDTTQFARAVGFIDGSDSVLLYGFGNCSTIALAAYRQLQMASVNAKHDDDMQMQLAYAAQSSEDDCAIIFSNSGVSQDVPRIVDMLLERNCRIIAVTSNPTCKLAYSADSLLLLPKSHSRVVPWSIMTGISAQLVLVDSLFQALVHERHKRSDSPEDEGNVS